MIRWPRQKAIKPRATTLLNTAFRRCPPLARPCRRHWPLTAALLRRRVACGPTVPPQRKTLDAHQPGSSDPPSSMASRTLQSDSDSAGDPVPCDPREQTPRGSPSAMSQDGMGGGSGLPGASPTWPAGSPPQGGDYSSHVPGVVPQLLQPPNGRGHRSSTIASMTSHSPAQPLPGSPRRLKSSTGAPLTSLTAPVSDQPAHGPVSVQGRSLTSKRRTSSAPIGLRHAPKHPASPAPGSTSPKQVSMLGLVSRPGTARRRAPANTNMRGAFLQRQDQAALLELLDESNLPPSTVRAIDALSLGDGAKVGDQIVQSTAVCLEELRKAVQLSQEYAHELFLLRRQHQQACQANASLRSEVLELQHTLSTVSASTKVAPTEGDGTTHSKDVSSLEASLAQAQRDIEVRVLQLLLLLARSNDRRVHRRSAVSNASGPRVRKRSSLCWPRFRPPTRPRAMTTIPSLRQCVKWWVTSPT